MAVLEHSNRVQHIQTTKRVPLPNGFGRARIAPHEVLAMVPDMSMFTTFSQGDLVVLDGSVTEPTVEGVYGIELPSGQQLVRRVQRLVDGSGIRIIADNPLFESFTIERGSPCWPRIVGRVRQAWCAKAL